MDFTQLVNISTPLAEEINFEDNTNDNEAVIFA